MWNRTQTSMRTETGLPLLSLPGSNRHFWTAAKADAFMLGTTPCRARLRDPARLADGCDHQYSAFNFLAARISGIRRGWTGDAVRYHVSWPVRESNRVLGRVLNSIVEQSLNFWTDRKGIFGGVEIVFFTEIVEVSFQS